jgi:histone-lysine N-methyltransferase SETMAR
MPLHDNCRVHKARQVREVIDECGFVEMEHPLYSPNLAPSDYYFFPKLKKHLRGIPERIPVQDLPKEFFFKTA